MTDLNEIVETINVVGSGGRQFENINQQQF